MFRLSSSTYQLRPSHLWATVAQIHPSIIVAPRGKEQFLARRITSKLPGLWVSAYVFAYLRVCVAVLKVREFCGCPHCSREFERERVCMCQQGLRLHSERGDCCTIQYVHSTNYHCDSLLLVAGFVPFSVAKLPDPNICNVYVKWRKWHWK